MRADDDGFAQGQRFDDVMRAFGHKAAPHNRAVAQAKVEIHLAHAVAEYDVAIDGRAQGKVCVKNI